VFSNDRSTAAMNPAFSGVGFWIKVTEPLVGLTLTWPSERIAPARYAKSGEVVFSPSGGT
jgi:hypothetical protein